MFLGEIFQTQAMNGWPDLSHKKCKVKEHWGDLGTRLGYRVLWKSAKSQLV